MLRAHRQAWAWQDEWEGLTMADVRRLERETQLILQKKLGRERGQDSEVEGSRERAEGEGEDGERRETETEKAESSAENFPNHVESSLTSHPHLVPSHHRHSPHTSQPPSRPLSKSVSEADSHRGSLHPRGAGLGHKMKRDRSTLSQQHRLPVSRTHSRVEGDSDGESMYSARPEWALDSIAMSDSGSELEFFDALGIPHSPLSLTHTHSLSLTHTHTLSAGLRNSQCW